MSAFFWVGNIETYYCMYQNNSKRIAACWMAFCFFLKILSAQEVDEKIPPMLNHKDTLLLVVTEGKKYILHPVKSKHTLFSLARYYGISLAEVYDHNPALSTETALHKGDKVKVPIPNKAIRRYKNGDFEPKKFIPIWYVVKEGDNLYQICQRYFNMPVDSIKIRNRMRDNAIRAGQRILMGWMSIEGIPAEWQPVRTYTKADAMKDRYNEEKKNKQENMAQGICFWQKNSKEKGDLYALHRDAPIGSTLMIVNPMFNRTVHAKVIGRIPLGYEHNIILILSPEAARTLGAKDERFFVKIRYLR